MIRVKSKPERSWLPISWNGAEQCSESQKKVRSVERWAASELEQGGECDWILQISHFKRSGKTFIRCAAVDDWLPCDAL